MSNSSSSNSGGIGFAGMLTILFIGLKLTGYIDWSWLWVLSPLWISFAIVLGILAVFGIVWGVLALLDKRAEKKRRAKAWERIHGRGTPGESPGRYNK